MSVNSGEVTPLKKWARRTKLQQARRGAYQKALTNDRKEDQLFSNLVKKLTGRKKTPSETPLKQAEGEKRHFGDFVLSLHKDEPCRKPHSSERRNVPVTFSKTGRTRGVPVTLAAEVGKKTPSSNCTGE